MVLIPNRVRVLMVVSALALAAGLLALAVVLVKPAQAQAETIKSTVQIPISGTADSCTGEVVFVEGTLHLIALTTTDANGGSHAKFHLLVKGQGEGLDSGDKYVYHDLFNEHANFTGVFNDTYTKTLKIIRQGSDTTADDFNSRIVFHVTVNANGEVTTQFFKFEDEPCT